MENSVTDNEGSSIPPSEDPIISTSKNSTILLSKINISKIILDNDYDLYKCHKIIYSIKKHEKSPDRKDFKHFDTALIILLIHLCHDVCVASCDDFFSYFTLNSKSNIVNNLNNFKEILKSSPVIRKYGIDVILIPNLSISLDFIANFGEYLFFNLSFLEEFAMNYYSLAFSGCKGHLVSLEHDLCFFRKIVHCNTFFSSNVMEIKDIQKIETRNHSNKVSLLLFLEDDNYECFIALYFEYFDSTYQHQWGRNEFYNLWRMVCKYDSVRIGEYIFDYFYRGLSEKCNKAIQKIVKTIDFNIYQILKLAIGGISLKILNIILLKIPESTYKGLKFQTAFSFDNITDLKEGENEYQIVNEKVKRDIVIRLLTLKSMQLDNQICSLERKQLAHFCFFKGDVTNFLQSLDPLLDTAMESNDQDALSSLLINFGAPIHQLQTLLNSDQLFHFIKTKPNSVVTLLKHLEKGVAHHLYCRDVKDIIPLIFFSLNPSSFSLFLQLCIPDYPHYYAEVSSLSKIQSNCGIFNEEKFNQFLVSHVEKRVSIDEFIKNMCDDPEKYLNNFKETKKIKGYELMLTTKRTPPKSNLFSKAESDFLNDLENEEKLKKQKQKAIGQKNKLNNKKQQQQKQQQKEIDNSKLNELQLQQKQQQLQQQQKEIDQKNKLKNNQPKMNEMTTKNTTTNNNNNNNTITMNGKKNQIKCLIDKLDKDYFEIGKFQFIRNESNLIGRGSNGTSVFKGIWSNKVPVAIKQMQKSFCNGNQITKEIDALITMTSKNCSNMIRYIDKEEDGLFVYLGLTLCNGSLQELIDKGTLQQFIDSSKHGDCLKLFGDIINGIQFLHSNDMVHNDLNPRNILYHDGSFIISDFGLSKMEVEVSFSYTQGVPSGLGGFHPAEVLEDKRKTKSVDIFSLGCILFVMLTNGQHPFGSNLYRVVNILRDKPDLSALQDNLFACDLIRSMISKDESKRPLIQHILSHPLFWSNDYKIKFIDAAFNLNKDQQNNSLKKHLLNSSVNTGKLFLNDPWNLMIDEILLPTEESSTTSSPLIKKANYQYDQVYDLIRFIRNTIQHHKDISIYIQQQQQQQQSNEILLHLTNPESVLLYFESKIPHLIYHLYQQLKQFPNNSDYLNSFFTLNK